MKYRLQYVYSILLWVGLVAYSASAFAINGRTTYQAKIYKPDGQPLESVSVNFRFTVLDPSSSCVLFVEDYAAVNMIGSGGLTSFSLGMGTRTYPASGPTTFAGVFDNSTPSFVCQTPGVYNPIPTDNRKVVMQFNEGSGWQTLPAMAINSVPYAMYSAKAQNSTLLNGKADSAFVEVSTLAGLSCQANEAIKFNGATFSCIAVGVSSSGISSVTTSGTVLSTGGTASAPVISITAATMSSDGYLTSLDYAEFKAKLSASSTQIINTLGFTPVSSSTVGTQIQAANLAGDVSGTVASNFVQSVGGKTSAQVATSVDDTIAATSSSTANTIVKRNASGNFTANDVYANAAKLNYVDIYKPSTSFNIRLQAPTSLAANYTLNLPTSSGTVGQVLSTDGSGNLSWISAATGSVTSVSATAPLVSTGGATPTISITQATSATDGYLSSADWNTFNNKQQATQAAIIATLGYTPANATSATQWTTSGTHISYSAGNVGIGVTNPSQKLEVSGNIKIGANNQLMYDASNYIKQNTAHGWEIASWLYNQFLGTSYFSGNVGIGTTTPGFPLDVSGSVRTGTTSNGSVVMGNDGNAFIEMRENDSAGTPYIDFVNDPGTDFDFRFILNGDDSFSLMGGSVGIGTQNPTALLNLAAGSVSNAPLKFTSGTLLSSPQSGTMEYDGNQYYLTDSANIRRTIATGAAAGSIDNASNINSSGNITLTPTGSVVVSSTTASTDSNTGALIVKGGLGVAGVANFGSDISVAGRVGVGTSAPQTILDVSGVIRAGNNNAVQGSDMIYARYGATSETTGVIGARYSSGGLFLGYGIKAGPGPAEADYYQSSYAASIGRSVVHVGQDIDFLTASNQAAAIGSSVSMTSRFFISNAGNVGIGTTTPDTKVRVIGKIKVGTETDSVVPNTLSQFNDVFELVSQNTTSAPAMAFHHRGLHTLQLGSWGSSVTEQGLLLKSGGGEAAAQLHVQSHITSKGGNLHTYRGRLAFSNTPTDSNHTIYNNLSNLDGEGSWDGMKMNVYNGLSVRVGQSVSAVPTTALHINSSGNVGVGTTTPSGKLEVVGEAIFLATAADSEGVKFQSTYSNNETSSRLLFAERQDNAYGWSIVDAGVVNPVLGGTTLTGLAAGSFNIVRHDASAAGVPVISIDRATGNVGIGTTSPAAKLDVNGSMIIRGSIANPTLGDTAAAAQWIKVGTWTAPQQGRNIVIRFEGGQGFNSQMSQIGWSELRMRTSNGVSVDANGFCASAVFNRFGQSQMVQQVKIVSNAAGCAATAFDVYVYSPVFTGVGSFFSVDTDASSTWTSTLNFAASDPGAASASVYIATAELTVSHNFLVSGNVGIGTTNPAGILHVNGAGWGDQTAISDTSVFPTSGTGGVIIDSNYSDGRHRTRLSSIDRAGGLGLYVQRSAGVANVFSNIARFGDHAQSTMEFEVFGDAAFSGNLGIGTAVPSAKLHIVDESTAMPRNFVVDNYSGGGNAAQMWGRAARGNSAAPAAVQAGDPLLNLIGGGYDGTSFNEVSHIRFLAESNHSSSVHNSFIEFTTASGTTLNEQMRITSNGNVGIGTAAPTSKLDVNGGIKQPNHGALWVTFDGTTRIVTMPAFLTDAYMNTHQDEVYTWRAPSPTFKDTVGCGAGPNSGGYMFSNAESTWGGTYRLIIGKMNTTNIVEIQWAGWGVDLIDPGFTIVNTGSNQGSVNATLTFSGGVWSIEHMQGQVGNTNFSCH